MAQGRLHRSGSVALISAMVIGFAACGGASAPRVGSAIENSPTSEPLSAVTIPVVAATTTTTLPPVSTTAPAIITVPATTTPPRVVTAAPDPHGVAIETGCIRSDIDFDAVRQAPGVTQPEVGRIPPSTCNVLVYATGTDGRITWLEVGSGDIFGWSAQSNFVQTSFAPPPLQTPVGVVAATLPPAPVPVVGGAALDFRAQTLFGFGIGYVSLDQVVNVISAQLGPVTSDTGWLPEVPAGPEDDCSSSAPTRILSWGDLTITVSQRDQPGPSAALSEYLELWYVGDPTVSNVLGRSIPGAPTGLHTADGIGIGSTMKSVNAAYGAEFQYEEGNIAQTSIGHINEANAVAIALLAVDGQITGIGIQIIAC